MTDRPHHYLTVLGSCGTADSFRAAGWPTFVDEGVRIFDYVGRTAFPSLVTGALREGERQLREVDDTNAWGFAMAKGELDKTHGPKLERGARINQVLVFDVVTSFIFRQLDTEDGRAFLSSWEVEKYFQLDVPHQARFLWELDYEPFRDAAIAFLSRLRDIKPELEIGFHVAPACRNDGVRFKVDVLNDQVDFYYAFCERLARDLEAQIPRMKTLQGKTSAQQADPEHPYGRYPFHYRLSYYEAFRAEVKRWLGLPDETVLSPTAAP